MATITLTTTAEQDAGLALVTNLPGLPTVEELLMTEIARVSADAVRESTAMRWAALSDAEKEAVLNSPREE